MKSTGIFYGSSTGHTADDARLVAKALGVSESDIYDVANTAPDKVADYDRLIMGTSSWGDGNMQDDWYDFVAAVEVMDLSDKEMAFFGSGDSSMGDNFCKGVKELYDRLKPTGAKMIGAQGDRVGLYLDDTNHPELDEAAVMMWAENL